MTDTMIDAIRETEPGMDGKTEAEHAAELGLSLDDYRQQMAEAAGQVRAQLREMHPLFCVSEDVAAAMEAHPKEGQPGHDPQVLRRLHLVFTLASKLLMEEIDEAQAKAEAEADAE